MVITQFSGIVNEYLMVYPLGVDVFSRKKHEKELQKAARCAVVFYVAMFQQIISELARLFGTERCSFLMVYPLGVDVFSRKKHKKEPQKAARCAVIFMW